MYTYTCTFSVSDIYVHMYLLRLFHAENSNRPLFSIHSSYASKTRAVVNKSYGYHLVYCELRPLAVGRNVSPFCLFQFSISFLTQGNTLTSWLLLYRLCKHSIMFQKNVIAASAYRNTYLVYVWNTVGNKLISARFLQNCDV